MALSYWAQVRNSIQFAYILKACSLKNTKVIIISLCKHVVAKVTLVPCSVDLTGQRDKVGHGEVTINNARMIRL